MIFAGPVFATRFKLAAGSRIDAFDRESSQNCIYMWFLEFYEFRVFGLLSRLEILKDIKVLTRAY